MLYIRSEVRTAFAKLQNDYAKKRLKTIIIECVLKAKQ